MKFFLVLIFCTVLTFAEDFFSNSLSPSDITITVDETIYLKIKNTIEGQTKCEYQAPGKKDRNSLDFFVKFTDDACGIKIEKVQKSHEGVWKLISTFRNSSFESSIRGTSLINVKEKLVVQHEDKIYSPKDNFAPPNLDINYCYISKYDGIPLKISEINPQKCMIPEDIMNEDFQTGMWTVRIGVKGVANEISYSVNVQSTGERNDLLKLLIN